MLSSLAEITIILYVLIGVANYAAHVMTCRGCQRLFEQNLALIFQAVMHIFGWPFAGWHFINGSMKRLINPPSPFEGMDFGNADKGTMMAEIRTREGKVLETITGKPGESLPDFMARVEARNKEVNGEDSN